MKPKHTNEHSKYNLQILYAINVTNKQIYMYTLNEKLSQIRLCTYM